MVVIIENLSEITAGSPMVGLQLIWPKDQLVQRPYILLVYCGVKVANYYTICIVIYMCVYRCAYRTSFSVFVPMCVLCP